MQHLGREKLLKFQAELASYGIHCRVYEQDAPYKYVWFDGEEHRCETNWDAMEMMIHLLKRLKGCNTHKELCTELQKRYMDLGYDSETAVTAALADMNEKF